MSGRRWEKGTPFSLPAIPGVSPRDCPFPGFLGKEEDGDADGGGGAKRRGGKYEKTEEQSCQMITVPSTNLEA